MGVSAEAVQITINVTDANSGIVVDKVRKNIDLLGTAGAKSGKQVKEGMEQAGVGALSSVEKTRLLTEEFGIRLPRAMVKLAAESKAVQATIGAISTGLIGLGAIQIGSIVFESLIGGAEKLWHNYLNINAAAEDYGAEVEKTKNQDFGNSRSIETTRLRIAQATAEMKAYHAASEALDQKANHTYLHALDPAAAYMTYQAKLLEDQAVDRQRKIDSLQKEKDPEQRHQSNVEQIELQHAGDGRLRGEQKITAEYEKQLQLISENARAEAEQEGKYGNPVARNSLWTTGKPSQDQEKMYAAGVTADAERFNLQRTQAQELAHLREAALEASLRGSALYHAQEAAAIQDLKFKDMDSVAARSAIHLKFHNEEMRRMQDQGNEIRKMRETTALGSLTGVARIQQEGRNRINDVLSDPNSNMNPSQRLAAIDQITRQTNQAITKEYEDFATRVDGIVAQSADRAVSGFARIHADAQRSIRELESQAKERGGKPEDLQRGTAGIRQSESDQVADLQRKNAQETSQIEAEARSKFMSAEKNQTAAIENEYEERLRRFQEWKNQELSSDQLSLQERQSINEQFDRRVVAAGQARDAELEQSARQAREKMASEFTQFFKNPMQAMKEMGEKAAGETAAALMQRIQNHVGGVGGSQEKSGGIFDRIAGAVTGHGAGASGAATHSAASAMISVGTAQISIGGASLSLGGAGSVASGVRAGGSSTGSSFSTSGGSTGLFAPTGSGDISSGSTATSASFAGSAGTAGAASGGGVSGAIGTAQQGMGLFSQGKSMFGGLFGKKGAKAPGGGDTADVQSLDLGGISVPGVQNMDLSGLAKKVPGNGSMLSSGMTMGNVGGAASGAMGLFGAVEGNGGLGGALNGAMSGMELGMALGGPIGAAIGAAGGAIVGAIGFGGIEKARVYDLKTIRPRIVADTLGYQQGTMDYGSAYADLQSLDRDSRKALEAMGTFGKSYYWDNVSKEIKTAADKFTGEERAGRSQFSAQAAQYAIGADSIPRDGLAYIHRNERIMPSDQNERITRAIEGGAESTRMPVDSGFGGDIHLHVHSMDSKTVMRTLMDHKHDIRAAYNASFGENSGGADAF